MSISVNKRILLITRYFPPLDSTATSRMYSWAKYLHRAGFGVSILTTSKQGQVVLPYEADVSFLDLHEVGYFDPITFAGFDKKSTLGKMAGNGNVRGLKRKFLSGMTRLYRERMNERMPGRTDPWILPAVSELRRQRARGITYDHIISSYGPPSCHIVGRCAKRIFDAPWLADYRDLWKENHVYSGLWPFTAFENIIEKNVVSHADAITTVSRYLADVLQQKFPKIPVSVIENGYDTEEMTAGGGDYFDDHARMRIIYAGSIYRGKQDPSPLFRAVRELMDAGEIDKSAIEVLFWGSAAGNLEELIDSSGASEFARHCGTVSKNDSLRIQKSADALLFLEWGDKSVKDILTAKLFEYIASDKPILALGITRNTSVGRLIEKSGAGLVCGNDIDEIKEAVRKLLHRSFVPRRNRDLIGLFSRKAEVDRLIRCLDGEVLRGIEF